MKIKYEDFKKKTTFSKEEMVALTWGHLIKDPPPEGIPALPAPPLLMVDRVLSVEHTGSRGKIIAETDIHLDDWFFQCHFRHDPVKPGCLGVDAIWQLLGLYISLRGGVGSGRALGAKEVDFFGQIRPHNKVVRYEVSIRRYSHLEQQGVSMVLGDGSVFVDGEQVYQINQAKVGSFLNIRYDDYPLKSQHAIGGVMAVSRMEETI
ncbi:bifunctional 3-hydroxydecanoyl-ACP dehydratase/trans-2-decenoyl-ACP isomerase [Coxiella burnetii]|uniref:bifunctional 3-hydroxydecanoyl-ACP dehydratase/trans-2-decenoyl-ACP isomerase n=1 Tax=Coxiella burnetii TaxID=777 RepID=UPI000509C8D2|nr:bifunctional 3-hydroxydecanoyl-ACP dehydratase/trans-2-decenoyl-ACP isomerase [Coxiella burnetii]